MTKTAHFQQFKRNANGRDFAVGDIHGHFTRLQAELDRVRFDSTVDRLFSVGDLVDRGPENIEVVMNLIGNGWFFAVRGNHDDFAIRYRTIGAMDEVNYRRNGGGWFIELDDAAQDVMVDKLLTLPFAIEVETEAGLVGIVHADVPWLQWKGMDSALQSRSKRQRIMWSRDRFELGDTSEIEGVDHLVVGHNSSPTVITLGNVHHIDTGGWLPEDYHGRFTLLDLNTMEAA